MHKFSQVIVSSNGFIHVIFQLVNPRGFSGIYNRVMDKMISKGATRGCTLKYDVTYARDGVYFATFLVIRPGCKDRENDY